MERQVASVTYPKSGWSIGLFNQSYSLLFP